MSDKLDSVISTARELDLLRGEYESIKLWGSCPDGDIKFNSFIKWIAENDDFVHHVLLVTKNLNEL